MAVRPPAVRIADPALAARVSEAVAAFALDFPLELADATGPSAADALWIAVLADPAARAEAVRQGAVDAIDPAALDRLPIAVELARRALRLRALDRLLELSPDVVELTGADMKYLDVNPAFERLFGIPRERAIGRSPGSLLRAGTHGPGFYEQIERRLTSGRAWTGSMVARRGDGVSLQELVVAPVLVAGTIARYVGIRRDLSTSWLEPLDEAPSERLRDHLERHATRPWVLHEPDGTIVDVSEAACRLVGKPRTALLGTPLTALDGGRPPVLVEDRWQALPAGATATVDTVARTPGGPLPVEARSAAIALGDARFVLTVLTDITERLGHEREIERARDAAVRANEEKSAFLANMSHELRTPLNAIVGYTELLLEDAHTVDLQDDLERIRRSAYHLLGLVDDILDLSRIEARRLKLALAPVRVADVVREVAEAVRPAADAAGNRLIVRDPPPDLVLVTDRRRLAQVLLNLMGNACKFTKGGNVELEVRTAPLWTEVVVADDGPGLPPDLVPRLFQPFERAQAARGTPGTGLGLAISQRLARALGGDLRADTPAKGARFVLTLPR